MTITVNGQTVRLGGKTLAEVVEAALEDGSLVVAYGVRGASPDGWTSFNPDIEALRRYIAHGRSRIAGKAGHVLVYGPSQMVHDYVWRK